MGQDQKVGDKKTKDFDEVNKIIAIFPVTTLCINCITLSALNFSAKL